jgi:hypothetical protein
LAVIRVLLEYKQMKLSTLVRCCLFNRTQAKIVEQFIYVGWI